MSLSPPVQVTATKSMRATGTASGRPGILLDNIRGQFGSAALEGFLTSELYTDRVLGRSLMLSLPTNVLFLISGNNFHPKGDLYRRILTARIDAKTDAPERRTIGVWHLSKAQAKT